ncbi:MAG: hypothetical protein Q9160_007510 [Pyrenula sp. 1 TL-2023]
MDRVIAGRKADSMRRLNVKNHSQSFREAFKMQIVDQDIMNGRSAKLCTVSLETGWFPYAIQDLALFHSTIYHWAALNRAILPDNLKDSRAIWKHKGSAIHLVNDRLRDTSVQIEESTVASVACLASISVRPPRQRTRFYAHIGRFWPEILKKAKHTSGD